MTKQAMLDLGVARMDLFCDVNRIVPPVVSVTPEPTRFGTCAFYRSGTIYIWPPACAHIGKAARAWSYPGHSIDRTPYGVIAHELGHHVDGAHGSQPSQKGYGRSWRVVTGEKPLTGYCRDDNEWFAEMFRLFVTNPDLLRLERPKTHALMRRTWKAVEARGWEHVLMDAERQLALLRKRHAVQLHLERSS